MKPHCEPMLLKLRLDLCVPIETKAIAKHVVHSIGAEDYYAQRAVTADTALRRSRYFGTRPAWWMDLQTHYDLETAADKLEARIARAVKPCGLRPMPELVPALGERSAICPRRGWRLGGVGPFGVVACGQAAAVTTGELLADAELIH